MRGATDMTTLLPPGKSQFFDSNGNPLAGGSVAFYIPGTTTFKPVWQDPQQLALNTNPVILDAAGEAVIYGSGSYRTILQDNLGNTIWDQLTASTDAGGIYSGGTSTGTAANQIVAATVPAGFALVAGNQLTFIAGFTSTGATTLNANGTGAKAITKSGGAGPVPLVAGDIVIGNAVDLFYDGTQYQMLNRAGALTLTGVPINEAAQVAVPALANTDLSLMAANTGLLTTGAPVTITQFGGTIPNGGKRYLRNGSGSAITIQSNGNITTLDGNDIVLQSTDWVVLHETGAGQVAIDQLGRGSPGATKAQMQAGTDATKFVTASIANQSDSAAKAWVTFSPAGAIVGTSYNVTSVTKNSTGNFTVTLTTPFASVNFVPVANQNLTGVGVGVNGTSILSETASTIVVGTFRTDTGVATDPPGNVNVVAFGRQ
jgi:hypothetical protein